jgi:coenzyme F420-reducing hydrogenase gamma subunit
MKIALLSGIAVMALAGCGSGGTKLKAGQYEMTMKMTDVQVPGAPPAAIEQMKAAMAAQSEQTQQQCVTEEDIANMGNKMGSAGAQGGDCNFTKTTFNGGAIDIAGTCKAPTGDIAIAMNGTHAADSFNATMTVDATANGQQVKASGTMSGRRTGDCTGAAK